MADIIVRIPENQVAHFLNDKLATDFTYWRFTFRPLKLKTGDYIFFTLPHGTSFASKVTAILSGDDDEFSGYLDLPGNWNAVWNGETTVKFEPPIEEINYAHRGFRYLTKSEQKKLRARLN